MRAGYTQGSVGRCTTWARVSLLYTTLPVLHHPCQAALPAPSPPVSGNVTRGGGTPVILVREEQESHLFSVREEEESHLFSVREEEESWLFWCITSVVPDTPFAIFLLKDLPVCVRK